MSQELSHEGWKTTQNLIKAFINNDDDNNQINFTIIIRNNNDHIAEYCF